MLVLGAIAIAAGIIVYFEASSFQKKARLTEGKVITNYAKSCEIQYFTDDGTGKIKQVSFYKNNPYHDGQSVKVWYLPGNPDRARVSEGKKGAVRIFIIAGFCFLMGVYPLFLKKKVTGGT